MKTITLVTEIAAGGDTRYVPVPCRGIVHSMRLSCDATMVADKTVVISRASTAVNTATADGETAGNILDGTPTSGANKYLIFDPDSSTAANKVLKIVVLAAFVGSGATLTIRIKYDDSAFVEQAAKEA